jgi:hypothetical protein
MNKFDVIPLAEFMPLDNSSTQPTVGNYNIDRFLISINA